MKRNITLDYFRIILSISVIFTHFFLSVAYNPAYEKNFTKFEFNILWELSEVVRIVVAIFLMISGYYLNITDGKKTYTYFIRILKIYVVWALFYLPWCFYLSGMDLIITLSMGFYHLWYLPALMGAIILLYPLRKVINNKIALLCIAIILYITGYIIQTIVPNFGIYNFLYRNALFFGLPFLLIGNIIRDITQFKFKITLIHVIIGILLILIEGYVYLEPKLNYDMFFTTLIVSPFLFIYVLQTGKMQVMNDKDIPHIASGIYYIHPAIIMISSKVLPQEGNIIFYQFPFIVIMAIFTTFVIIKVNKTIKIFL